MDAHQHHQYVTDRHEAHVARRNLLNDLAFKTSERYDQWLITLAGGELAISLGFLEKIAPSPASNTLFMLGLAWFGNIASIIAGFSAIFFSRKAIYHEIQMGDEFYKQFRATTTPEKPEGDPIAPRENQASKIVGVLNWVSLSTFAVATMLLCCFAYANITPAKGQKELVIPPKIDVNVSLLQAGGIGVSTTNRIDHEETRK